jgi:L-ascorbate metabolism protein UlaG (beta-lactamase superfamily)
MSHDPRTSVPGPSRMRRVGRWMLGLAGIAALIVGVLLMEAWTSLGQRPTGERLERISQSEHFKDGQFVNRLPVVEEIGKATVRWLKGGNNLEPDVPLPLERRTSADFATPPASGLRITWLGHSTLILEIGGKRILTDPVFSKRTSPSQWWGPARFHEVPLALADLPALDAVIISHDHFDHLDMGSIKALAGKVPFFTPLGVGQHLEYWGGPADQITELDWWQSIKLDDLELHCTPSRHFSGRSLLGRNATQWASWSLISPTRRLFFSGDTGMFPGFSEIGERLGPFDVTLLEVGAYDAAWADVHLGPEQAVAAHKLLRGTLMMPVHWGTFNLAVHAWTEPAERLIAAADKEGVTVRIPRPGGQIDVADPGELDRWWPDIPWETAEQHPVVSSGL